MKAKHLVLALLKATGIPSVWNLDTQNSEGYTIFKL